MKKTKLHFSRQLLSIVVVVMMMALLGCAAYGPAPAPAPVPAPAPAPSGESVTIDLTVEGIKYGQSTITVPAGSLVTIKFDNKDTISHNFALYKTESAKEAIFIGNIISKDKVNYEFTAPTTPGTYFFRCDVHPGLMTGEFIVTRSGY